MALAITESRVGVGAEISGLDLERMAGALAELVEGDEEALPLCGTSNCGVC